LDSNAPVCEQLPSVKSNPIVAQSSESIGRTFQFMTTYEVSQKTISPNTESEALTLYAEGSPAKISVLPATEQASTENDQGYGKNTPVLLAHYDPTTSSWKMSQRYLFEDLENSLQIWPRSGMTRNGIAYRLRPLKPRITETEFGLWPTPDTRGFVNEGSVAMLAKKCKTWDEYNGMAYRCAMKKKLRYWTKPRSEPLENGPLNPAWIEWLMGYPEGWTDLEDSETPSSRKSLK